MPQYTKKNLLVDLGFINGCLSENMGEVQMAEPVIMTLDSIEQRVIDGKGSDDRLLHDLGYIRGVMWLKPMPCAYSRAIDRIMEFLVEGVVECYGIPQPWCGREHNDQCVSDDQRETANEAYLCESAEVAAEETGLPVAVIERIVHPAVAEEVRQSTAQVQRREQVFAAAQILPSPKPGDVPVPPPAPVVVACAPSGRGRRQWTPEQRAAQAERARNKPPLVPDSDLEAVKAQFDAGVSFDRIAKPYKCSGSHIRNFLLKHGIDPRRTLTGAKTGGRPPLTDSEIQLIIAEKAKGTPSKEIGEMIDRSQHAVDQKYSDLKKAGLVPGEHLTAEALEIKKQRQNDLVSEKMKAFHAGKQGEHDLGDSRAKDGLTIGHVRPEAVSPAARWKPSPLSSEDWTGIQAMLAQGRSREAIASDYDVPVDDLDAFIEERLRAAKERHATRAAEASPPGESHAPLPRRAVGA